MADLCCRIVLFVDWVDDVPELVWCRAFSMLVSSQEKHIWKKRKKCTPLLATHSSK